MNDLLVHPSTRSQLDSFIASPSHAVILVGRKGSGKLELARNLATELLPSKAAINSNPYAIEITSVDGKAIGIDAVRNIDKFLSLKVPSSSNVNRVVIIDESQTMGLEAQNALLKTLEEPPEGTLIILTATNEHSLLPTIMSRAQSIDIKNIDLETVNAKYASKGISSKIINQNYHISSGLPSLLSALMQDNEHPLLLATKKARDLLGQTTFERLLAVDELAKNINYAQDVLYIMQQMAHVSLANPNNNGSAKWQQILQASYEASEALNKKAQPKLALTKLMLAL